MKFLLPLAIFLAGCSPFTRSEKLAIGGLLANHRGMPMPRTTNAAPITIATKFASTCPYCGEINMSQSTAMTSGTTTTNGVVQSWTISFRCRNCLMPYTDYREQVIRAVRSVRLPVFGE